MQTVSSFHASAVEPHQIGAIMVDYLALERARTYRRLFVARFGLLAACLAVIGFGFHWISALASWVGMGLCSVPPVWAWMTEVSCDRRLARSLEGIPGGAQQIVVPPQAQESHKKVVSTGAWCAAQPRRTPIIEQRPNSRVCETGEP